jgi:trehalose 6-phosphate phosphatase
VPSWLLLTLERLQQRLAGALAIVSGRPLTGIDALLHPLVLPASGAHGVERRGAAGHVERREAEPPAAVLLCAAELAACHNRLVLELKPSGLSLHFRMQPELGELCRGALAKAVAQVPGAALIWELLNGHFVCELKQRAVSKGSAVLAYLAEPEFANRLPVFIGDDVTDEDGIWAVQSAGGFGIRVGTGPSQAQYRLADTNAVAAWLQQASLEATTTRSHSA